MHVVRPQCGATRRSAISDVSPADVSAVVCTMNSIRSIRPCLESLRRAGVGEIVVVDANSDDGTRAVADELADLVLEDPGIGLGVARNLGIARTSEPFVLNIGSDNVITAAALLTMLRTLIDNDLQGVSARTVVEGDDYLTRSMNDWWQSRFRPGPAAVIGTPSLFRGDMLRADPFDDARQHSDDSDLCQRWMREYGARFAISSATVAEVGKNEWSEVALRCRNYGVSDYEVFSQGRASGWSVGRQLRSLLHPAKVDLIQPVQRLGLVKGVQTLPFLVAFATMRYASWAQTAVSRHGEP